MMPTASAIRACLLTVTIMVLPATARTSDDPRIADIRVIGNSVINSQSIISASGLQIGDRFSPERLRNAKQRILNTGNFGAILPDPNNGVDVIASVYEGRASIVIKVVENELVRQFEVKGSGPIGPGEVLGILMPLKDQVLNLPALQRKVAEIREAYERAGYQGYVSEELALRRSVLTVPIVVGRVGGIHFEGVEWETEVLLRSLLRTREDSFYRMDEVRKDINWLQSLGFELVNTVWEAGIPDLAPIQSSRDLRFRYTREPLRPARIRSACTIQDSSAPVISEIRVVGAREVSAQSIIVASQLEIGAPATDSALRNAKLNLLNTGLFGMRKRDPAEGVTVAMRVEEGKAVITMEVDENPVIRGFDIAGSGPIPQREILKVLKPLQGAVARTSQLLRVTRDIRQMLEDRGYQGFVTEGLTVRDNTLLVPILISVIRDVEFRGIDPWLAALIQSGLRTHPGGYYNVNYLKRDLTWILQLGFKNVEPSFAFLTPGEVRISLATQPR